MSITAKIKSMPIISLMIIASLLMVGLGIFNIKPNKVSVAETTDCFGAYANMYGVDSTTGIIKGLAKISVGLSTSTQAPSKVVVLLDGNEVGQARPESGSNYSWTMLIPTKLLDPKDYEVRAILKFPGYECVTPPTFSQPVDPAGPSEFILTPNVYSLELPINSSALVSAALTVPGYSTNYAQFALFDWIAESRGSVTPTQNRQTSFYSGPNTGTGKIKIIARYGFRAADTQVYTKINDPTSPINSGSGSTSSGSSSDSTIADQTTISTATDDDVVIDDDTVQTTTERTATISDSDVTKDCAVGALGKERFEQINKGEVRPTTEEVIKLKACFARTNYILPSNFAPVAPGDVSKLQRTSAARIDGLESITKDKDGELKQAIRLSGKAKPNSVVVIYIYSEPMVLTTTANENGEWIYELENPLEPGSHTMYAVVDRGDGVYERTDPIEFAIGSAEATADNPAGLSLLLDEQATAGNTSTSTYLYIVSSGVLLAAVVLVAIVAYRHGKHSKAQSADVTAASSSEPVKPDEGQILGTVQTIQPSTDKPPTNQNSQLNQTQPQTANNNVNPIVQQEQTPQPLPKDEKQV